MELFAVIMAGGVGSRFWPRSKEKKPKQLIRIFGENTMIQDTVKRLEGLVANDHIFIVTNKVQKMRVKEQLPQIPEENFRKCLSTAADFAYKTKGLVTIGITPNRPETGYGYIQFDEKGIDNNIYKVLTFAEKPNLATARRFIESGDFLWNAGIFIWRVDTILEEIKNFLPDLHEGLLEIESAIGTTDFEKQLVNVYGQLKSISIDYGVMEKAHNVYLTKADFYWNDVGSWEAVYEVAEKDEEGNALVGDVYTEKTFGSYVFSPKKFVATIGVENLIIIDTHEALLVCNRDNAQEVRQIVEYLKMNKRSELI